MARAQLFLGTLRPWAENASEREQLQAQAVSQQEWEPRSLPRKDARSDA